MGRICIRLCTSEPTETELYRNPNPTTARAAVVAYALAIPAPTWSALAPWRRITNGVQRLPAHPQELSEQRSATPRVIQWALSASEGSRMNMTKLVECPVVESVPRRAVVR